MDVVTDIATERMAMAFKIISNAPRTQNDDALKHCQCDSGGFGLDSVVHVSRAPVLCVVAAAFAMGILFGAYVVSFALRR